jgi:hypothetical protein
MMKLQNPLLLFAIVTAVLPAATPQVKAADGMDQCPRFQFNPPDAYKGGMKYSFVTPDSTNPKTGAFASVCTGFWREPNPQQPSSTAKRAWSITVSKKDDPKVADSYNAEDGYAADLARADSGNAVPYLYARFQKISVPWGNAVGYFVQTTKNATWPEPNNVQLIYEIRGVTSDRQNTVVARFAVRHPQLPDGPNVLDAHSDLPTLTSFPSYKLLEKSRPESFEPTLAELQYMVSSIVILKPKKPENSEVRPVKSAAAGQ